MLQQLFRGDEAMGQPATGMTPRLRIGLIGSVILHVVVLLLLLIGLPVMNPRDDEPPETTVAMVFQGNPAAPTQASPQATSAANEPALPLPPAAPTPPVEAPPPTPQPAEAPPPPPPPQAHVEPAPPVLVPPPPAPPPDPAPVPVVRPPPPAPPAPPAPAKAEAPLPLPPPPVPPPPAPPSQTAQPNVTKNAAPDSSSVENTLQKLRQQVAQSAPTKVRPQAGGQSKGAGSSSSASASRDDTAALNASQAGAIADRVRECWSIDAGALDIEKQHVLLTVTTDASGVAREAVVAPDDLGRMSDPRFRAFAERAIRAVRDARCANLPLPNNMLGKVNHLTFRFRP